MPNATQTSPFLDRNIDCIGSRSARFVEMLRRTEPRADVEFRPTPQGAPAVTLAGRPLCSLHRPLDEAARLADGIDVVEHAVVAVLGFGAGYHVQALARRLGGSGLILVFEPDLGMLRRVLETIDHSAWLGGANVAWISDPQDHGELGRLLEGTESIVAHGVTYLAHPPSRARLAEAARRFTATFGAYLETARTSIMTALTRSAKTVRNLLLNLDHYAAGAGVAELSGTAEGCPAVVVAAGPSLRRNLARLADPQVRHRCVIIAVQTALQPMLELAIRPHFVTALDHHEISRRFYAGLRPADVEGVTLVADPKAHPVCVDMFPGAVRCCASTFLDEVLGNVKRDMGALPAGGTVAQLALYLARHLGCNPIALIGQDLAFSDGLYYAPGTAIAEVWAPELNAFNTIEMMEWQRIVRHRPHLRKVQDVHGRRVYADGQMLYYLRQFERDFARYEQEGITVIDATEGGLPKQHALQMPLADVLETYASRPLPPLPAAPQRLDPARLEAAAARVDALRADVAALQRTMRHKATVIRRMIEEPDRMERDRRSLERYWREVEERREALAVLRYINQLGTFRRLKADRRLQLLPALDGRQRQRARLQRDLDEAAWIGDAAGEMDRLLEQAAGVLTGPDDPERTGSVPAQLEVRWECRVAALVPVDPQRNGLGMKRSLAGRFAGRSVLQATLERLGQSRTLAEVVLLAPEGFDVERLIERAAIGLPVEIERTEGSPFGPEQEAIAAARRWSPACWRGGIAGMSVYDEVLCPRVSAQVMAKRKLTAALLVGADWPLVDPSAAGGLDAVVRRHRQLPHHHNLVFTQAPPGLGGCLVSASLMEELCLRNRASTVGALLAYQPGAPQPDPIAKGANVQIEDRVARARLRATFDSPRNRRRLHEALEGAWSATGLPAGETVTRLAGHGPAHDDALPQHLVLELTCAGAPGGASRPALAPALAGRLFEALKAAGDAVITLGGFGDPLLHPQFDEVIRMARQNGLGVHVRTELLAGRRILDRLLEAEPEVVSVDLHADSAGTYRRLTGVGRFDEALGNVEHLAAGRRRLMTMGRPRRWPCRGSCRGSGVARPLGRSWRASSTAGPRRWGRRSSIPPRLATTWHPPAPPTASSRTRPAGE